MIFRKVGFFILLFLAPAAFAQGSNVGNGGGGGEPTFIYFKNVLINWIEMGALNIDTEVSPKAMDWHEIVDAMKTTSIQFSASDELVVGNSLERVCKNFPNKNPALRRIECNLTAWNEVPQSEQLALVFHEYLGLLGYESNSGDFSNYPLSSQLIGIFKGNVSMDAEDLSKMIATDHEPRSVPEAILAFVTSQQGKRSSLTTSADGSIHLKYGLKDSRRGDWDIDGTYLKNGSYYLEIGGYGTLTGSIGNEIFKIDQKRCPSIEASLLWNERDGIESILPEETCFEISGVRSMTQTKNGFKAKLGPSKHWEETKKIKSDGSMSITHDPDPIYDKPNARYFITIDGKTYRGRYIRAITPFPL